MEFSTLTSKRGQTQVLYGNRIYSKKARQKTKKEKVYEDVYWKCTTKNCTASLVTDIDVTTLLSSRNDHSEQCLPTSEKKVQYRKIFESVKRKATEDMSERPEKFVKKRLRLSENKDLQGTKVMDNLKRVVYRCRNEAIPHKVPDNVPQVGL